jgi:hypothetical protein
VNAKTADRQTVLTFGWLHRRVQHYVSVTKGPTPSEFERWSFWVGIGSAGLGLIVGATWNHWLSAEAAILLVKGLLATEVAGLLVFLVLMLRRELPQFTRSRQIHASEMDGDFGRWQELVEELRQFSPAHRAARLRFVQRLRANMDNRMGVVFGGTQRLGVFPLLIALYLQFRNWKWGDWAAAFDVNLVSGLLIWAMLLLYAAGWLLIGLRTRLDAYENLLQESLEYESKS